MKETPNLFQAGRIAALELALNRVIWTFPAAQTLIDGLRAAVQERPGVAELLPLDPKYRAGFLETVQVLGRPPK